MKTVSVLSRKGGAGKTTVSLSLAMAARQAGLRVLIADVDPLHSAAEVLKGRPEAQSLLIETTAARLSVLHEVCRAKGYDLMIVDTPPAPEGDVVLAIHAADFCLVVARPSALDLAAVKQTLALVRQMRSSGLVVLNQCPPPRNGAKSSFVEHARQTLQLSGMPLATNLLRSRAAYQRAFAQGLAVTEWDPESDAAKDVLKLLAEVVESLSLAPGGTAGGQPSELPSRVGALRRMQSFLSNFG